MLRSSIIIKPPLRTRGEEDMIRIPTHRAPTHPGEMLLAEFLVPMRLTQRQLASAIRVPYQRINELVNRRRGITPSTALRFAQFFGNSADFWMNLQLRWDLYHAQLEEKAELKHIRRWKAPPLDTPSQPPTMVSSHS
jgi:antitoxin HigA-1